MNEEQARQLRKLITNVVIATESEAIGRATGISPSGFFHGKTQSFRDANKELHEYINSLTVNA